MMMSTSFQRRKEPRYEVPLQGAVLAPRSGGAPEEVPCAIVDISRHGVSFKAPTGVLSGGTLARLKLTLSEGVSLPTLIRLLRQSPLGEGNTHYVAELSFETEKERRKIHTYISSLNGKDIAERRKGKRRGGTSIQGIERRVRDRRRRYGVFEDCASFASRAPTWKSSYTLFRRTESTAAARINVNGRELISYGSNDYFGLSHDPRVKEAAIRAVERFGATAGSRVLNGTLGLHEDLERALAEFKGAETALLFTGGYLGNIAILTALLKKGDVIFLDERAHASIIDGCMFSGAKLVPFRHNSVEDLQGKIERMEHGRSLIIIDGVYSIEGDLARLPEIYRVAREECIPLMVDDAHGFGVVGPNAAGTAEHFGLNGAIDLDLGMLGGALGGVGAFVACKSYIGDYLRHFARGFLFTTTLPPATTAGLSEALRIIRSDAALRARLWSNVEEMKAGLNQLGYRISPTESAIVSLFIGNEQTTYDVVRLLEEKGVFVNAFIRPAVKRGEAKVRLTITAAHSKSDIALTLHAFGEIKPMLRSLVPSPRLFLDLA